MPEITNFYFQSLPKMKFVGKCYKEEDKVNDTFGAKWEEWFNNNLFAPLQIDGPEPFPDCNAYYGLCRESENEPFAYYIGAFLPLDFAVPEGYESIVFEPGEIAVSWIYGKEPDIYFFCCLEYIKNKGYEWAKDSNNVSWCFERYVNPRFTTPDEKGNIVLDMCFYVKPIDK